MRPTQGCHRGVTLVEILIALGILLILGAIIVPVVQKVQSRSEMIRCSQNLRNLHVALSLYIKEEGHWPQIPSELISQPQAYGEAWMETLEPYGLSEKSWLCPTISRTLQETTFADPDQKPMIHYTPTAFDKNPLTPFRWATQPWALEIGSVHGQGALVIFPDGSVEPLNRVAPRISGSR